MLLSYSKIFSWFKNNKRKFLWRTTKNPYKIIIAEFMLQRTKANQVEPVYKKFLKQYPDVYKLSRARFKSVAKYTSKLGIHWRAHYFIKAAKFIVENYKGKFPKDRNKLLEIPGVGNYVSGAILTVCFNKPEYVIDSNIARFINRYYDLKLSGEIRRKKQIIEKAKELFSIKQPGKFLFCVLDFTALICKPQNPNCDECCLKKECKFFVKLNNKTKLS